MTIAFTDSGISITHKALTGRIVAVNDITCIIIEVTLIYH